MACAPEGPNGENNLKSVIEWAEAAWAEQQADVLRLISPEVVHALSRWARKEMANYRKVSLPDDFRWRIAGYDAKHQRALLEVTIETLPSHSPLVTRWLKLYIVVDTELRRIEQAIVTVRGEAQE